MNLFVYTLAIKTLHNFVLSEKYSGEKMLVIQHTSLWTTFCTRYCVSPRICCCDLCGETGSVNTCTEIYKYMSTFHSH